MTNGAAESQHCAKTERSGSCWIEVSFFVTKPLPLSRSRAISMTSLKRMDWSDIPRCRAHSHRVRQLRPSVTDELCGALAAVGIGAPFTLAAVGCDVVLLPLAPLLWRFAPESLRPFHL